MYEFVIVSTPFVEGSSTISDLLSLSDAKTSIFGPSGNSNLLVLVGSYPKSEWLPENRRERGQFAFGDSFDCTAQCIVMSLGFNVYN